MQCQQSLLWCARRDGKPLECGEQDDSVTLVFSRVLWLPCAEAGRTEREQGHRIGGSYSGSGAVLEWILLLDVREGKTQSGL